VNWKNETGHSNRHGVTGVPGGKRMKEKTNASHLMESHLCENLKGFDVLVELALDMRSSWSHGDDSI